MVKMKESSKELREFKRAFQAYIDKLPPDKYETLKRELREGT